MKPTILLGTYGNLLFKRALKLSVPEIRTHSHVLGVSSSGKSRFLGGLYLALLRAGLSSTLIDPHGDLAELILGHKVVEGVYSDPAMYERLIYLDLPAAERRELFFPFNAFKQHATSHSIASNVKEAFHRAWPQLAGGQAPMFDTLVQDGVKVLLSNGLPITALYRLLTDTHWRNKLLEGEDDHDVVAFFHDQYDKLSEHDRVDQAGAALRRAHLLTFSPVLKYSLGQMENVLDFRSILDNNQSAIINLALGDAEARRLLGCLITVSAEQGALSRADIPLEQRKGTHHLMIDEFSEFTAQSEEALARILSLTRKYGLYLVMAHQTFSQASERLQGALQNVGIRAVFQIGRSDAEQMAKILGKVNPLEVKHEVADEGALDRTHPVFYSLPEQWEEYVQELTELRPRQAYIKYHRHVGDIARVVLKRKPHRVVKVKTVPVPNPKVDRKQLEAVKGEYLKRYFRPKAEIEQELAKYREQPITVQRRR